MINMDIENILSKKKKTEQEDLYVQDFEGNKTKKETEESNRKENNDDEDEEEEEEIVRIIDPDLEKELLEKISNKAKEVVSIKNKMEEGKKPLKDVALNGSEIEKEKSVEIQISISEFQDKVEAVGELFKEAEAEAEAEAETKQEAEAETKQEAEAETKQEAETQATTSNIVANTLPDEMFGILEKLEKIIELGNKILERLDSLLEIGKNKTVDLKATQNVNKNSMKY